MGNILNEDFQDFIKALNANDVEYLLVGGYSVIAYGYPRTTGDMDIWVNRTQENYKKLSLAFTLFKMPVFDMTEDNFLHHPHWDVFRFGKPPIAIEIMIKVKGLSFDECFKNSQIISIDEIPVRIINYSDLIEAKKKAGRPKDLDDIQGLENKT